MEDQPPNSQSGDAPTLYGFGGFILDTQQFVLRHGEARIPLRHKVYELLRILAENSERVVTKTELLNQLWRDTAVLENNIAVTVREARRTLASHEPDRRHIETVSRRGYRMRTARALERQGSDSVSLAPSDRALELSSGATVTYVGRVGELARLNRAWGLARNGNGRTVLVNGSAGVGKTALLQCFLKLAVAEEPDCEILWGHCTELLASTEPYLPWFDALDMSIVRSPSLLELLRTHAPEWLSRVRPTQCEGHGDPHAASGLRVFSLAAALRGLSRQRPLLVVLEDLHWADAGSVDLLNLLQSRLAAQHTLLIGTYRPQHLQARRGLPCNLPLANLIEHTRRYGQHEEIELSCFSHSELVKYVQLRLGHSVPQDSQLIDLLWKKTEGHPLFASRAVDAVLGRNLGPLVGTASASVHFRAEYLPLSLEELWVSQLRDLSPLERDIVEGACVLSGDVDVDTLAELFTYSTETVSQAVNSLQGRRWLEWVEVGRASARFRFTHRLLEECLYKRLHSEVRRSYHQRVATLLVRNQGQERHTSSRLASHLERAGEPLAAARAWLDAGDFADRNQAKTDALSCYGKGESLLPQLDEASAFAERVLLEHGKGWSLFGLGRYAEAAARFQFLVNSAEQESSALSSPLVHQRLLDYFEQTWTTLGNRPQGRLFPQHEQQSFQRELHAEGLYCACCVAAASGELAALQEHANQLFLVAQSPRSQSPGSRPRTAEALAWLGYLKRRQKKHQKAKRDLKAAIQLGKDSGHTRPLGLALRELGWLELELNNPDQAHVLFSQALALIPDIAGAIQASEGLAAALTRLSRPEDALAEYQRGHALQALQQEHVFPRHALLLLSLNRGEEALLASQRGLKAALDAARAEEELRYRREVQQIKTALHSSIPTCMSAPSVSNKSPEVSNVR